VTLPTFLVAGGARCGTTGLVEGLRRHPRIFVADPKEPHYFALHRIGASFTAPGDAHTINRVAVTDRAQYLALYEEAVQAEPPFLALGEGSVSTMYYYEESLPEVLAVNPQMKLVVLLREPVDRAFSAFGYMRARGLEPIPDFLEAVAQEEERREAGWHHIWHYTGMSHYADSVAAMQEALPPDQLGFWFYDDLNRDYEGTVSEVLTFLGVPEVEGAAAEVPRVNISGEPRSKILHEMVRITTGNERLRAAVKRTTSYRFREAVRRRLLRTDTVGADARAALSPIFEADLARLRQLLPTGGPEWLARTGAGLRQGPIR
jgi:Sulfotransferase family